MQTPTTCNINLPISARSIEHCHIAVSTSTNSELIASMKSGQRDISQPHLLTANVQTEGRGQHGRTWQSPEGNVYLSLYSPLDVPLSGLLSLMVGYHLTKIPIIERINQLRYQQNLPKIGVKWANDIGFYQPPSDLNASYDGCLNSNSFLGSDGFSDNDSFLNNTNTLLFNKLSGILIEPVFIKNRLKGMVIGVGMNTLTTPTLGDKTKEGFEYQAIGLADLTALNQLKHTERHTQTHKFDSDLLPSLSELYLQITDQLSLALSHFTKIQKTHQVDGFLGQFNEVDILKDKWVRIVQQHGNSPVITGIAKGLDKTGSLQIQPNNSQDAKLLKIFTGRVTAYL